MPIDTSIYQNIKPTEMASPLDAAQKAMSLGQLSMQSQMQRMQMQQQMAMRQAYAQNVDQNGNLNQGGVKSTLSQLGMAHLIPQTDEDFAKYNKAAAEAQSAQVQAQHQILNTALPIVEDFIHRVPENQKDKVWPSYVERMKAMGLPTQNLPPVYDKDKLNSIYATALNTKEHLENVLTQTKIGQSEAETANQWAEAALKKGGQRLRPEQTNRLSNYDSALGIVKDLRDAMGVNNSEIGPVKGYIASRNKWDSRGQMYNAMTEKATQLIGSALQHGVLDAASYHKYQQMMPQMTDTPQVAAGKIDQIERLIQHQKNADIDTYGNAGYNVHNFNPSQLTDLEITKEAPKKKGGLFSGPKSANASEDAPPKSLPAPKHGTVDGGYVFLGGDPSNKANWKKAR